MASFTEAPIRVVVSGAAGQIGYSLLPLIASGSVFGPDRRVHLKLLDIPRMEQALRGVCMELEDCAFPTLAGTQPCVNPNEGFKDVDVAVLVGGFPRGPGMLRKDLTAKNAGIFKAQGEAIEAHASRAVKVLVVANPANTNCWLLQRFAPSVPKANFSCLTRLDHNRATAQIAAKLGRRPQDVRNVTIWGNHSATQCPDASAATVATGADGEGAHEPVPAALAAKLGGAAAAENWLTSGDAGNFVHTVQKRGRAIIDARKLSSAMSAAKAIADHLRTWLVTGTAAGETVSMGVVSTGNPYGVPDDLIFSFPVRCGGAAGGYEIAGGRAISDGLRTRLNATAKELQEEREVALAALSKL